MTRTELNLICLVVSLVLLVIAAMGISLKRLHEENPRTVVVLSIVLGAWLTLTAIASQGGWLERQEFVLPAAALIVLPSLLISLGLAFSPIGRRLADGLTWTELVGFQIFRLPVELILYGFFFDARIPKRMTFAGSNYDLISGVAALVLVPLLWRRAVGVKTIWLWNIVGLGFLLNITVLAVMSAPGGYSPYQIGLLNTLPYRWPSVWIVLCVAFALMGHLVTFRKLLRTPLS